MVVRGNGVDVAGVLFVEHDRSLYDFVGFRHSSMVFNGKYSVSFVSRGGVRTCLPVHRSKVRKRLRGRRRLASLTRRDFARKAVINV